MLGQLQAAERQPRHGKREQSLRAQRAAVQHALWRLHGTAGLAAHALCSSRTAVAGRSPAADPVHWQTGA